MGLNLRKLSKETRAKLGMKLVNGHARGPLSTALDGYFFLNLGIDPPTVTHHSKRIQFVDDRPVLRDSPELRAVWFEYLRLVPERQQLIPLIPPIALHVVFRFRLPADWRERGDCAPGGYHIDPPDLDNQVKVLKDVLALRGYFANDRHVAKEFLEKRWTMEGGPPGIYVYARTLVSPADKGQMIGPDPSDTPGVIHPSPLTVARDVATLQKARPAELGTPGGKRVKDRKSPPRRWQQEARGSNAGALPPPDTAGAVQKRRSLRPTSVEGGSGG